MAEGIKISQCLIVKNEEKNIRQALSWGKGVLWEQIVVDIGSVDRTVEIAEEMGAKVFHFDWCDDISAAKNYAIELARGDWIVFLDADEFFTKQDAEKLSGLLDKAEERKDMPDMIRTAWMQLDDDGEVFAVGSQVRIFRNSEDIKYQMPNRGSLHRVSGSTVATWNLEQELSILHTGYVPSNLREAQNGESNIRRLRQRVEKEPENYEAWSSLGDALASNGQVQEAMDATERVMEHGTDMVNQSTAAKAFVLWFRCVGSKGERVFKRKAYEYYRRFCETGMVYPDVEFWMGRYLAGLGESEEAVRFMENALEKLKHFQMVGLSQLPGNLKMVYGYLISEYRLKKNPAKVVYYSSLDLRLDPYQENALEPLLTCLKEDKNTTTEQIFQFLSRLYDYKKLKDKLFILKAAKQQEMAELVTLIRREMTREERAWLDDREKPDWLLSWEEMRAAYPNFPLHNRTDLNFLNLIREIQSKGWEELELKAAAGFHAQEWKRHAEELLEFYGQLEDYRSRQCLYGFLEFWLHQELRVLNLVRENGLQFWDLDLIPTAKDMNCVSIGRYTKEAVNGFMYAYGDLYKHLYCLADRDEEPVDLDDIQNVSLMQTDFTYFSMDSVPMEELGMIRIDSKSDLLQILKGCEGHICSAHPKLAVCMDEDVSYFWEVPRYMRSISGEYRFYLRCYGTESIRFVLYAV